LPYAVIRGACPNCEDAISSERLELGLPCKRCLPSSTIEHSVMEKLEDRVEYVWKKLLSEGTLRKFNEVYRLNAELSEFLKFFENVTGKTPWSAQRTWAKRIIRGESFAIIAPTGVGKTTFLIVYSIYHAVKGRGRVYFIVPTRVLLRQVYSKILEIVNTNNLNVKVLALDRQLLGKNKLLESMSGGTFDILVSTAAQLSKNFSVIAKHKFSLIIVDDVDALLRNSRNVDRVLQLIGFSKDIVDKAYRVVLSKVELLRLLLSNAPQDLIEKKKKEITEIKGEIENFMRNHEIGQVIVSSATGRSRGLRSKIFRELLNFEAGTVIEYMRNIVDVYVDLGIDYKRQILDLVKTLGPGGLVFVSQDFGLKVAKELTTYLIENGVKASLASSSRRGFIEKFSSGKVDVLVGVASYYGVIVRGLDLPDKVRYALFLGVPKFQLALDKGLNNPLKILSMLLVLSDVVDGEDKEKVNEYANKLRKIIEKLSYREYRLLIKALREDIVLEGFLEKVRQFLAEVKEYILSKINIEKIRRKVKESKILLLREVKNNLYIVTPDIMTYIQASGRTSRMFANGMTKGLSIIIVDDRRVFEALCKQLAYYIDGFSIKHINEVDLGKILEEIDRDRAYVRSILEGKIRATFKEPVISALMIVESPTKAKTIASFFGRPSKRRIGRIVAYETIIGDPILGTKDYMVTIVATRGHILDLASDVEVGHYGVLLDNVITPIYTTIKRCRSCGHQFTLDTTSCPRCGSTKILDSKEIIKTLRKLAQEVEVVFIGTDPDSEGEKIAWDVYVLLKPYVERIYRIEFHEITRKAIVNALANPRNINLRLVEAQIVRRIEDRWIGFSLSPILWKRFGMHWLSAGRVQTPVLGWIIEKYEKWKKTRRLFVEYVLENGLAVRIDYEPYIDRKIIKDYVKHGALILIKSSNIEELHPPPPYNTNTLLHELSTRFGMDSRYAMKILQQLFESGLITYHRTDSIRVSKHGMEIARNYICDTLKVGILFKPRSWSSEGAHECIRPTRPVDAETLKKMVLTGTIRVHVNLTHNHYRVYDMIFRRFIASQMAKAVVEKTRLYIKIGEDVAVVEFVSKIIDEGFLKVLPMKVHEEWRNIRKGSILRIVEHRMWKGSIEKLYRQGDVIKLMKEKGIGRPSTYVKILSTLLRRGYVIESKNKYLVPTTVGRSIYNYLTIHFKPFISEETTRKLEQRMRAIENGAVNYLDVLKELYSDLQQLLTTITVKEKAPA